MSTEINGVTTKKKAEVDVKKRAFMKKFGKYAAVSAGMAVLMTPTKSSACNYGGGCNCGSWTDGGGFWDWWTSR